MWGRLVTCGGLAIRLPTGPNNLPGPMAVRVWPAAMRGDFRAVAAGRTQRVPPIGRTQRVPLPTCPTNRQAANKDRRSRRLPGVSGRRINNPPQVANCCQPEPHSGRRQTDKPLVRGDCRPLGAGRLPIGRRFCQPAPHSGKPQTNSTVARRFPVGSGRPITNRPQVNNLPHIASATSLRRRKIVAARKDFHI